MGKQVMRELRSLSRQMWLYVAREFLQRVCRLWFRLSWGWRIMALGAAVVAIMLAAIVMPLIWRVSIDAAGIAIFYGTVFLSGFPRIRNVKDRSLRIAFRWAFFPAVTAVALVLASVFLESVSAPRWSARAGVAGALLLLAALVAFVLVSGVVSAISALGRATVITGSLLLLAALFLFPPLIVFLMTEGQWPVPLIGGPPQANSMWLDLISFIPPTALFVAPDALRKILKWEDAKPATQRLLPSWVAGIALSSTCGYALALHFVSAQPLAATSLAGIALATLFVGVILWPLYKQIVDSCWRLGIADAMKFETWRHDQRVMRKELLDALRQVWRTSRAAQERQASGKTWPGSPGATAQPGRQGQPDDGQKARQKPRDDQEHARTPSRRQPVQGAGRISRPSAGD